MLNLSAPAAAGAGPDTHISMGFSLPPGVRLQRNPRLRITDARGQLFELLPMSLTFTANATGGHRDLHTQLYPPGVYQVQLEILYAAPSGKTLTATTPASALTVSPR